VIVGIPTISEFGILKVWNNYFVFEILILLMYKKFTILLILNVKVIVRKISKFKFLIKKH